MPLLIENVRSIVSELTELGKEVQKLVKDAQVQLQHVKEGVDQIKCDLAQSIRECAACDVRNIEIKRLYKELQKKEHQFQSAQQEAQVVQEKFSKSQAELEEKYKEVYYLRQEKEELATSWYAEREEARKFILALQVKLEVWYMAI